VQFVEILLIATGLSMDSFAVSLAVGMSHKKMRWPVVLRAVIFFGIFQGGFAALGWWFSQSFKEMIEHFDHWVAFALLLAIGSKMIWESIRSNPGDRSFNVEKYLILIGLSIATSIDALIVGMGLGFLEMPILLSVVLIGLVTIIFSLTGFILGIKNGFRLLGNRAEMLGGLILIGIGINMLIQHLNY
jgi:manganese efflux pump family protein